MLLDGEEVPAGEYTWMRPAVADPNVAGDSYITIDGRTASFRFRAATSADCR